MKEFRVLQTCSLCGEGFVSDYTLMKHMSKNHPPAEKSGRVGGDVDSCACGGEHAHAGEDC